MVKVKVKAILVFPGFVLLLLFVKGVGKKETGELFQCIRLKAQLLFSALLRLGTQVFSWRLLRQNLYRVYSHFVNGGRRVRVMMMICMN